jgi:uncharacterized membrane protein
MKIRAIILLGAATLWGAMTLPVFATASERAGLITFDAPGADLTANDYNGTLPTGINALGVVAGYYVDAANVYHGFLRTPWGRVTSFDAPGADTTPGSYNGTAPNAINDLGAVTGEYWDATGAAHGFLRSPTGRYTSFDVPGSGGFTNPIAINLAGEVVGYYADPNSVVHGFLRKPNGVIVTFDGPGACQVSNALGCYGSGASSVNGFGTLAAGFNDLNFVHHGLIRSPGGKLAAFDVPGAGSDAYQGTGCPGCSLSINASGAIAGTYRDSSNVSHGFLRSPEGGFTTFNVPSAGTSDYQGTGCYSDCPVALNNLGEIAGTYVDASYGYHGYLRSPGGALLTIDPPNSIETIPTGISELGVVAGYYLDANNVFHGFIRTSSRSR